MAQSERLKKRLLREAIEENLDTMSALRRWQRERRRVRLRRFLGGTGLAILSPMLLLGAFQLVHAVSNGTREKHVVTRPSPVIAAVIPALASAIEPPVEPTFAAEEAPKIPIDPAAFPLRARRIVIDPGHGGRSPGTSAGPGLVEKDLVLDIGRRLETLLEGESYEVRMTREGDETVPLEERASLANAESGDIFVSIHLNWFPKRKSRGVETYYLGPTDDPALTELAALENQESGYSLADMKRLVERVYIDARRSESRRLAEAVQAALYRGIKSVNPGVEDRGVKTAPFIVLLDTEMPAILAEVSCLSHSKEAALLAEPAYRQKIAEALFRGIEAFSEGHGRSAKGA